MFRILITQYNAVEWIRKSIESALMQKGDFDIMVIDDCSTDGTWEIIKEYPVKSLRHSVRQCCGIVNIHEGIEDLQDDDIVVHLSGDDYFIDDTVISYLSEIYNDDVWMTYGNFIPVSGDYPPYCKPIPNTRTYRREPVWYASHPITHRKWLFEKINDDDLKFNGQYNHWATDASILYPMIEMSGKTHMRFIERVLYVYNDLNPTCVYRTVPKKNLEEAGHFKSLPIYDEL